MQPLRQRRAAKFWFLLLLATIPLIYAAWPLVGPAAQGQPMQHPLDPLTRDEIISTVSVIKESGKLAPDARFATIYLKEPAKDQVLADLAAARARRSAFALLYNWSTRVTSEAVVDLSTRELSSWKDLEPNEPPMRGVIINRLEEVVKADQRWQQSARSRGIEDFSRVTILPQIQEAQKIPERNGDRFLGVNSFLRDDTSNVPFMTGMNIEVNLTKGTISRFNDGNAGARPVQRDAEQPVPSVLQTLQPNGPSFRLQGSEILWQNWRLHYGVHPRRGLELYDVAWQDRGQWRSILYRASVSEMIAPYGDPSFATWYPQDEGDYGLAVFASAFIPDDRGNPLETQRAVAIYERDGGLLWRHGAQSRRARKLVLTAYATIDMLGHLVAPRVNAPNHQHFFSFRLDFDIDGAGHNSVLELNTQSIEMGKQNPKGEAFSMTANVLKTEQEAKRMLNLASSRKWKVISTGKTNALGQFSGYALLPGENSVSYQAPNSAPSLRAGFINTHVWVTPYNTDEMFASGDYINLNPVSQGLPKWTSANRKVEDNDVVLWYTLGVTHIPRTEDWPIMPVHPTGFRIVPAGFFSQNPGLNVPATGK